MTVLRERVVPLEQRPHRPADLVLDQAAHGEQRLLERLQLLVESAAASPSSAPSRTGPVM